MENVVLTIHLLLALALIALVLLQRSEGGGLGLGGGGGGDGVMSGRAAASALTKLTWIFAVAFIITSLTLTAIAARKSAGSSVIDRLGGASAAQGEQQGDALDTDALLPPTAPTEAPLVPSAD
ncbi:preprotein translocase subunit SecG [Paracoccaceae bacterium]|nr:preprotein translocase subunit SecG [Paracoccaceae bacterium]MED7678100.1 preprotein translocase subunit SecG [Rhodobacteraceae bacterium IMCC15231]